MHFDFIVMFFNSVKNKAMSAIKIVNIVLRAPPFEFSIISDIRRLKNTTKYKTFIDT